MAETVVNFVLGQLADAAIKEILFLCGVKEQVEKVERELVRIQAFLKDVDSRPVRDERQKNWVKEVRDIAYWIEDVIDTATLLKQDSKETESHPKKMEISRSSCLPCKKMFRKSKKIPALHELGVEIDQILARMKEIEESRIRYGINSIGEGSGGLGLGQPIGPIVIPDIDNPNVIGLEKDTNNIVKLLLDENTTRRSVVSIVGTGGLGKTTLAHKAYNRIGNKHFDTKVWVTVSKEFNLIELLKMVVKQFRSIESSEHHEGTTYFLAELHKCCTGKKYLIVLDDVWKNDLWTKVGMALPDENNGSRILITSRSLDVAKEADPQSEPYQLKFLTEKSSLELLLRKALPNHYPSRDYPDDLVDLAKQFVKKCGGLPLALVVLGGLLSKKSGYNAWKTIMRTLSWSIDGRVCFEILANSFDDLPLSLKYCFMYLAIFPEDYYIDAKILVRMWVAEGLIPEFKNRTLEDTGERFLEELVQRCMIQVSSRLFDGSIEVCRIHDLLRDLAIQKAKDEDFLTVSSTVDDLIDCCSARRLTIHHSNYDEFKRYVSKNLRSLVSFGDHEYERVSPNCSKQRLLKVLQTAETKFKWLEGLTLLRYFKLTDNLRVLTGDEYFERFLCSMKYLQTLDLGSTILHPNLSDCIWHVKTLRHVMLSQDNRTFGPPSWTDLRNLQTLTGIKSSKSWETNGIPNLRNLRNLDIEIAEGHLWDVVASLLGTLKHLIELRLSFHDVLFKVADMKGFPFYTCLQRLHLSGCYDGETSSSLVANMFPTHLTELYVSHSRFNHDPMPILEKLQALKKLSVDNSEYHQRAMRFSAQGFVRLECLELTFIQTLEELETEEGALPMLKDLDIVGTDPVNVPVSLEHAISVPKYMREKLRVDKLVHAAARKFLIHISNQAK